MPLNRLLLFLFCALLSAPPCLANNGLGGSIPGWYADTDDGNFEIKLDTREPHSGKTSACIKSLSKPKEFGNVINLFDAQDYRGKRIRMTAWVKTRLNSGTAQLWLRIDGDWESAAKKGVFDNMQDRPIKGTTGWTSYSLVVDVPETSTDIVFGLMLIGTGEAWLDDVSFEAVGKDVPLTGMFASQNHPAPINLGLEPEK